jgi:hypothetical protein
MVTKTNFVGFSEFGLGLRAMLFHGSLFDGWFRRSSTKGNSLGMPDHVHLT